ncbi:hypothetical protein CMV_002260 [Castanea mollissima]|uniref:Uncharacterized protein n=1 Tax=Castanea mollissima TaxID=60419 RepID=A0A8J4VXN3_9ROSI|nr:hypothetical protein CMV_002260 [Castanea mollissima]
MKKVVRFLVTGKKSVNTTPEEISVGTEYQTSVEPKGKFDNYTQSGKGIFEKSVWKLLGISIRAMVKIFMRIGFN